MVQTYSMTAVRLHWLVAALIFLTFPLGVVFHEMPPSPEKLQLLTYHAWIGQAIMLLVLVRIFHRRKHPAPDYPEDVGRKDIIIAKSVQHNLYLLLLLLPLTGAMMLQVKGITVTFWGLFEVPHLIPEDQALGDILAGAHKALNFLLLALTVLHVGAALKHHFISKDTILMRMVPFLAQKHNAQK